MYSSKDVPDKMKEGAESVDKSPVLWSKVSIQIQIKKSNRHEKKTIPLWKTKRKKLESYEMEN